MKLSTKLKYGILACLYLYRAGRAKTKDMAENLGLNESFLKSVTNTLKRHGVLKSIKGPGGGYELTPGTKFADVFNALDRVQLLNRDAAVDVEPERRALSLYTLNLGRALTSLLNREVSAVMKELVANEMAAFDKVTFNRLEN